MCSSSGSIVRPFWRSTAVPAFALLLCAAALAEPLRIAAAISLKDALTPIASQWNASNKPDVELSFSSSGQIAGQIHGGAPIDVFLSAAREPVEQLLREGLVDEQSLRVVAKNQLVLIVPAVSSADVRGFEDLPTHTTGRIAIGEPKTVPAGMYAEAVLRHLNLLDSVRSRLVYGANVRQVLDYVARGEVDAGMVYATDARIAAEQVRVVATADDSWHPPIEYVAAVVNASQSKSDAARFIDSLLAPPAQTKLLSFGFSAPPAHSQTQTASATNPAISGFANVHLSPIALSLFVASAATFLVALIGVPLAWWAARSKLPGRGIVETVITLPLVLPPTVVGYLLIVLLGSRGVLGHYAADWFGYSILFRIEGAVLAAAIVAFPLLYLPAKSAFAAIEHEQEDIAALFGATRRQVFWHVALPAARTGIASGMLLAFARALGEFGATLMVFGWQEGRTTLPLAIYSAYERGRPLDAWPLVLILMSICLVLLVMYNRTTRAAHEKS